MRRPTFFLTLSFLLIATHFHSQIQHWEPKCIGGGGALFSPTISPFDSQEYYITSDLSAVFHSTDAGENWQVIDHRELSGADFNTKVHFTSDPDILYSHGFRGYPEPFKALKSTDGGTHWDLLPTDPIEGEVSCMAVDPNSTQRLLISNYHTIQSSTDGGRSWTEVYSTTDGNGVHLSGAFWDGNALYVGTGLGLLYSPSNNSPLTPMDFDDDLPSNYGLLTMSGAKEGGQIRLFGVARPKADIWSNIHPNNYWNDQVSVYTIDMGDAAGWQLADNGLAAEEMSWYVGTVADDIDIAYVAGADVSNGRQTVYRTENGGALWSPIFHTQGNENIATGWMGEGGDLSWTWAESSFGLAVAPSNPDVVLVSDWGFAHTTTDGGQSWRQVYQAIEDSNPVDSPTPQSLPYEGNGLEVTSAWWLTWTSADDILASYTDITGVSSHDGGTTWARDLDYPTSYNTTYQILKRDSDERLYAATSSIHDMYQSTYLTDGAIDGGSGEIFYSDDDGENWTSLHDFAHPVFWMAIDPNDEQHLYASVIHSTEGGIYHSVDNGASWSQLADPPRTQGHPHTIEVLDDGTLVTSYSGRRDGSGFTESSGVFSSTDNGQSWTDLSHSDMMRWSKDLIIDPHDQTQNTWYICISSHWGTSNNEVGGIMRTTNRGLDWQRVSDLYRVESLAIDPTSPGAAYICSDNGLYFSADLDALAPSVTAVDGYPFSYPMRAFFDPYEEGTVWVTSFGNGIRKGSTSSSCIADINNDGTVNVNDFIRFNSDFGLCTDCDSDLSGDGMVDVDDFLILNTNWGVCD